MQELTKKAWRGVGRVIVGLAALLFLPAGMFDYWQAWIFLILFSLSLSAIALYLIEKDPALLERRLNGGPRAETRQSQKIIHFFLSAAFGAEIVVPGIDHHFGWSHLPAAVSALGDLLVLAGFALIFLAFKANRFAAPVIEIGTEHQVIETGLYGHVRHPMYSGLLVMLVGAPLALGSGIGLLTVIPSTLTLIWRLRDEEAFLVERLPGYAEYRTKTVYRLVPYVW